MQIGPYHLSGLETGYLWLDGGAMFGEVPRVLWERRRRPDPSNRIQLAMRSLLIQDSKRKILVDCGVGDKELEVFRKFYRLDLDTHTLKGSLLKKGLTSKDITHVIVSHLHFDHAGGATLRTEKGTYKPSFPNAVYYLQSKNLKTALAPNAKEKASYRKESFEVLLREDRVEILEGPKKLFPGLEIWVTNGHTRAQQHVKISDGKETLFHAADLIPTSDHVRLAWTMGYDIRPLTLLREKKQILEQALVQNWVLFFEHDPLIQASRVKKTDRGYRASSNLHL